MTTTGATATSADDRAARCAWWSDDYLDLVNEMHEEYPNASRPIRQALLQALHDLLSGATPSLADVDPWVLGTDHATADES
jgi:hypothetical protein